jgi:hypothetical protein
MVLRFVSLSDIKAIHGRSRFIIDEQAGRDCIGKECLGGEEKSGTGFFFAIHITLWAGICRNYQK